MERLISGETTNKKRKTTSSNKRRKTTPSTPQSTPNPSLPDDLLLLIIARVPILFYPILSLVSKSFRSLLASPRLYKARSLLGRRESRLYVCINMYPYKNGPSWFTLCRKPDRTTSSNKEQDKSSGYVLARVPIPHSPLSQDNSLVAVGSDIYNIGVVRSCEASSSSVWILDCRSHTWRQAPSLPVELFTVTVSVLDQKIYVAGICLEDGSDSSTQNSLTVLDTKTQVSARVPIPCSVAQGKEIFLSTCVGGKVNLVTGREVVDYNPVEGSWEEVGETMCQFMFAECFCVVDNVLYSCAIDRVFRWYHAEVRTWRNLEGLVGLPELSPDAFVRLADYGGKLVVLWNRGYGRWKMLCCAEISLERRNTCEIWGKVEWFDHVLSVPGLVSLYNALSATL
ncbi:unnamed protein product [Arabidopsis halleri]